MAARWTVLLTLFILFSVPVLADGDESTHSHDGDWNGFDVHNIDLLLSDWSVKLVYIGGGLILLLTAIALYYEKKSKHKHKIALFLGIAIPTIIVSLFIASTTIFVNTISSTGGPVHWHADYQVRVCGERLDLTDPTGLTNRIGTPKFHEHNEDRIHIEGKVIAPKEVSLGAFFQTIGGKLLPDSFAYPTNEGMVTVQNGETCDGEPAEVQVFVYEVINPDPSRKTGFVYRQRKLTDFSDYVLSPYAYVPPGDCLIIEFAPPKERTEHKCETYTVAEERGDLHGG